MATHAYGTMHDHPFTLRSNYVVPFTSLSHRQVHVGTCRCNAGAARAAQKGAFQPLPASRNLSLCEASLCWFVYMYMSDLLSDPHTHCPSHPHTALDPLNRASRSHACSQVCLLDTLQLKVHYSSADFHGAEEEAGLCHPRDGCIMCKASEDIIHRSARHVVEPVPRHHTIQPLPQLTVFPSMR